MKGILFRLMVLCMLIGGGGVYGQGAEGSSVEDLLRKMYSKVDELSSLRFQLRSWERMVSGKTYYAVVQAKVQYHPMKVYIYREFPYEGIEVLYNEQVKVGDALLHPNGFPWFSMWLDIDGTRMMEDAHHDLSKIGLRYLADVVKELEDKAKDEEVFDKVFTDFGEVVWEGRSCYKLAILDSSYELISYVTGEGETMGSIGSKLNIWPYKIYELNGGDRFEPFPKGTNLTIPSNYAKKAELLIDTATLAPVVVTVFDEKGMLAKYEFVDLKLNPGFAPNEFDREFYGF